MGHFLPLQRLAERDVVTAAARCCTLSAYNFGRFRLAGDSIRKEGVVRRATLRAGAQTARNPDHVPSAGLERGLGSSSSSSSSAGWLAWHGWACPPSAVDVR